MVEKIPVKVNPYQILLLFKTSFSSIGDSGGPIHQWSNDHWIQVGIVSFGRKCGESTSAGVYTKLSAYHSWFESLENETGRIMYGSISIGEPSEMSLTVQPVRTDFILISLVFFIYFLIE